MVLGLDDVVSFVLLSSVDSAVVASCPPISEAVMTTLSSTQCDEIDEAIRELDLLSKVKGAECSCTSSKRFGLDRASAKRQFLVSS